MLNVVCITWINFFVVFDTQCHFILVIDFLEQVMLHFNGTLLNKKANKIKQINQFLFCFFELKLSLVKGHYLDSTSERKGSPAHTVYRWYTVRQCIYCKTLLCLDELFLFLQLQLEPTYSFRFISQLQLPATDF